MTREPFSLDRALRALDEDDAALGASRDVAESLRAEVRTIRRVRRRRQYLVGSSVLAVLVCVGFLLRPRTPPAPTPETSAPTAARVEVTTAFFPLTYGDVPLTDAQIVRLEVPRTALAAFGLDPFDGMDQRRPSTVLADVLVGEDGLARAVRFVK